MRFTKEKRQGLIDGYLAASGRNLFVAGEFIDWLGQHPEHECYDWFFGLDDQAAAREFRIGLARRLASGLRIVLHTREETSKSKIVQIAVREYPAFVSPMQGRRSGGGYAPFDPMDAEAMAELQRQGRTALRSWLARYASAFAGVDLTAIKEIAAENGGVALSA